MALTEQEILANTLKSQSEGGSAMAGGALGAGADVPSVLANDPATRQLLEESVRIQSGKNSKSVITSESAQKKTDANVAELQARADRIAANKAAADAKAAANKAAGTSTADAGTSTALDSEAQSYSDFLDAQMSSYTEQVDAYSKSLDADSLAAVESIKATYARRKDQMAVINKNSLAGQTILGSRSGRQRYASELQTSILTAEEQSGIARLADLDREEQTLIREAEAANNAAQFALLNDKMTQLTGLYEKKRQLVIDQQSMAYQNEQLLMQKAQASREQAKFESEMAQTESFFKGSDIVSLMKELPAGQTTTVTDPSNGAVYTIEGLASESADLKQYMTTDDTGKVRILNYDPNVTNADGTKGAVVSVADAGDIGKGKAAGTTIVMNQQQSGALGDASAQLQSAVGSDGYTNTDEYIRLRTEFSVNNPGKTGTFDETFKHLLNPNDQKASQILTGEPSSAITDEQARMLTEQYGVAQEDIDMARAAGLSLEDLMQ